MPIPNNRQVCDMESESNYQNLVGAAKSLVMVELLNDLDIAELTDKQLASFLDANRSALDAASEAMASPCSVPLEYSPEFFNAHTDDIQGFRDLARAFSWEAERAGRAGDLKAATAAGVSILDLGNAIRNGGLLVSVLVSHCINGIGVASLRRLPNEGELEERVGLSAKLLGLDASREPFEEIELRDRDWEKRVPSANEDGVTDKIIQDDECDDSDDIDPEAREAIVNAIKAMAELPPEFHRQMQKDLDDREGAMTRLLAVDVALRAYRQSHDRYPECLIELVPQFVREVPISPFDGQPLRYHRRDDRFSLYCVGPSGSDNGGTAGHWLEVQAGNADLTLQMLDVDCEGFSCCACGASERSMGGRLRSFFRRLGFGR